MWLHLRRTGFCTRQESPTCETFSAFATKTWCLCQSSNRQTSLSKQRSNTPCGPFFFFDNNPAEDPAVDKGDFPFAMYEDDHVTIRLYRARLTQVGQSRTPIVVVFKREVKLAWAFNGKSSSSAIFFSQRLISPTSSTFEAPRLASTPSSCM